MKKLLLIALLLGLCGGAESQTPQTGAMLGLPNVFSNTNQFTLGITVGPILFSNLGTIATSTTLIYISDGTLGSSPCSGGGTGALATRVNGAWSCSGGGGGGTATGLANAGNTVTLTSSGIVATAVGGAGMIMSPGSGSTTDFAELADSSGNSVIVGGGTGLGTNWAIGNSAGSAKITNPFGTGNISIHAGTTSVDGTLAVANITDSALTPGTSPICPNGTSGAFTTVGCAGGGGGIGGSGTPGTVPEFTAGTTLGNSPIVDGGTTGITVTTTPTTGTFNVNLGASAPQFLLGNVTSELTTYLGNTSYSVWNAGSVGTGCLWITGNYTCTSNGTALNSSLSLSGYNSLGNGSTQVISWKLLDTNTNFIESVANGPSIGINLSVPTGNNIWFYYNSLPKLQIGNGGVQIPSGVTLSLQSMTGTTCLEQVSGVVTSTGSACPGSVTFSGNTTTAVSAATGVSTAPANDALIADGAGNAKDSGVLTYPVVALTSAYSNATTGATTIVTLPASGNIPAGATVGFHCDGLYNFATTAEHALWTVNASQAPQDIYYTVRDNTTAAAQGAASSLVNNTQIGSVTTVGATGNNLPFTIDGLIFWNATTAGNIAIQGATSNAAGTMQIPAYAMTCKVGG